MSNPRRYGWVRDLPDFRDLRYTAPIRYALPPAVDLAVPPLPAPFEPAWDQGRIGSCGPNSCAADIVFALLRQQQAPTASMPSRLFLYYNARQLMGTINSDSGVSNRDMLKALARWGWCDESLWPYDPALLATKPRQECYDQAAGRKIGQYLSVPQQIDQMRSCLASGDPFIFGFTVYESFESDAVARTGVVPMPGRGESVLGGHDVLIVGYDDAARRFKFRNSWGPQWGQGGYGTIPYEYATSPQLAGDFWTVRGAPVPAPTPTPTPPQPTPAATVAVPAAVLADALRAGGYTVTPPA
jgi:C1A family cysteine protease